MLTGAAGGVAHLLRPALQDRFDLVLTDRVPTEDGSAVRGDLTDTASADDVTAGVDAIVHLAANPDPGATWEQLYRPNVQAVANLLTGAARNGVRRLVLASSAHAMGQYVAAGRQPIDPAWRPFCSERCKLRDLARWADESYRVPAEKVPEPPDDDGDNG